MEWFFPRRRGPEWKQGWTSQTVSSISAPPLPLLTIFGIVMLLLWLSQYTDYRGQTNQSSINFLFLFILLPVLLIIFFAVALSSSWRFAFSQPRLEGQQPGQKRGGGGSGFPWRVAVLLAVILALLSHQSSFQSKWSGALSRSY